MHDALRQHIRKSLTGDFPAHASFQDAVADWPHDRRGVRPEGLPYSGWELVEHIRLAQADLLRYSQNDDYAPDTWPDAYWPDAPEPPSRNAWHTSCETVVADRETLLALLDESDPFEPVPTMPTTLGNSSPCAACWAAGRLRIRHRRKRAEVEIYGRDIDVNTA